MLSCSAVYQALQDAGVRAFTGVPDSLLKDFYAYLSDHTPESAHTIAANEGSAGDQRPGRSLLAAARRGAAHLVAHLARAPEWARDYASF